jgi:hypothetical protein
MFSAVVMPELTKSRRGPIAPQIIAIVMLLWAIIPTNPYGYYILLRWICCATFAYLAYIAYQMKRTQWAWVLGVIAFIYNPIFRIHLTREIWTVINLATIAIAAITIKVLRSRVDQPEKNR